MSTYPKVWINGVTCEDAAGTYGLDEEHPPRNTAMPTIQGVTVPGVPGAIWTPQGAEDPILFTVVLKIVGPQADADTQFAAGEAVQRMFAMLCAQPRIQLRYQTAASGAGSDLYAEARISSFTPEMDPKAHDWRKLTMVFEIPSGFWADGAPGSQSFTFSQAPSSGVFYTIDSNDASNGPLLDGQVRILGPATNPVVLCEASGDWWAYNGTIPGATYLRFDIPTLRAYTYTANNWTSTTTEVSSLVSLGGNGWYPATTVRILPGYSVSSEQATITGPRVSLTAAGITGSTRLEVRGRRGYR